MEPSNTEKRDSDSNGENEKTIGTTVQDEHRGLNEIPDPDAGLSDEERKKIDRKLLWKLDLKLIPWLSFLYLISFLGMSNPSFAHENKLTTLFQIARTSATLKSRAWTTTSISRPANIMQRSRSSSYPTQASNHSRTFY